MDTTGDFFARRYNQVYTKNLTAHRGTDNQILIEFVNQDQKRVDVTGRTFTCRLISHDGTELLLTKDLVMVNELAGQTKLVLLEEELDLIAQGLIGFSIEQTSDSDLYEPVFVDDNAGGRGNIDVVDSIMPAFVQSAIITVPDHLNISDNGLGTLVYTSSVLDVDDNADLHTFQFVMHQFTGEIKAEGAIDATGPWYTIGIPETVTTSDLHTFSVAGFHPYIRFTMTEDPIHLAGAFKIGYKYRIATPGTTVWTDIGAANNSGDFVATGVGAGDGTATPLFDTITEIRHR